MEQKETIPYFQHSPRKEEATVFLMGAGQGETVEVGVEALSARVAVQQPEAQDLRVHLEVRVILMLDGQATVVEVEAREVRVLQEEIVLVQVMEVLDLPILSAVLLFIMLAGVGAEK
jgi:hypothetical protein